jgi:hypothetical protein
MTSWLRRNPIFIGVLAGVLTAGLLAYADVKTNPANGGSIAAGSAGISGCTASTLLWVDSGGLVQCGATALASSTTLLRVGGSAAIAYAFGNNATLGFQDGNNNDIYLASNGEYPWASGFASSTNKLGLVVTSNYVLGFSGGDAHTVTTDISFYRVAVGVMGLTTNSDPANRIGGWLQNSTGEASLAANYTNATATLSATNLSYTVISGRHYNFDVEIHFTQSTAAEGVQIAFDGGSAAATDFIADCNITNTGGAIAMTNSFSTALATVINAGTTVVTTQSGLHCHGMFTPSGAGTFILRAAESGAHVSGTLTFLKGSSLVMRDTKVL